MTPIRQVVARPADENRHRNPYNALLTEALRARGLDVVEWTPRTVRDAGVDTILHVHWPESHLNHRRWVRAAPRSLRLLIEIARARRRGASLVWTVHNLGAHDSRWHRTERTFWRAFLTQLDGWLALSDGGQKAAVEQWPRLAALPSAVTPHGHYRGAYPTGIARDEARRRLGLPPTALVSAFVGRIKPYKGVEQLVRAFRSVDDAEARLVIAGRVETESLRAELRAGVAGDDRITVRDGAVADDELQVLFAAADLVVAPFVDILNSGSVLLALSFDRPVLVPDRGAMPELQARVGGDWVHLYGDELTGADLETAMGAAAGARGSPDLSAFGWDDIAGRTVDLYELVVHRATPSEARR